MKNCIFILLALVILRANAQQSSAGKDPQVQLSTQQKQLLKQMGINTSDPKQALKQLQQMKQKGQQPDFKAQGQNMLNGRMTTSGTKTKSAADLGYFTNNASLVPAKDIKRINSVSKKIFSATEMLSNTKLMYNKMMAKIPASEKAIITSIASQSTAANELSSASVTAMMQGHPLAALGLSMQAVMSNPANLNFQNNMAALLTTNGYPENAIPYLNTIQQQLPNNSTVKNNLGYAWLNLGEIDSAQRILTAAAILNPENPETATGTGVIEEKKGNKEEAGKKYDDAFIQDPSSMIEIILGNAGRGNPYDNMTFDQIKNKITIYEYFKKEWLTIPELSNSVGGYQSDIGILNGYTEMFKSIVSKLEKIEDSLVNAKDGDVPTVFNRQAQNILKPIMTYYGPFIQSWDSTAAFIDEEFVKKLYKKAEDDCYDKQTGQAAKCEVQDRIYTSEYLQKANQNLKVFYPKHLEKFRVWINAFITYALLNMNHEPKQRLIDVIYYSKIFIGHAAQAIAVLRTQTSACNVIYNEKEVTPVEEYQLPKLICPLNIKTLTTAFDYNFNANISKSTAGNVPNVSIAIGSSDGGIAEPGKAGTPYVKSSQGEVSSTGINGQDAYWNFQQGIAEQVNGVSASPVDNVQKEDYVTPLAEQIKQEAGSFSTAPKSKSGTQEEELWPLGKAIYIQSLKEYLQDRLGTDCDELKKMDQQSPAAPHPDIQKGLSEDKLNLQKKLDQLNQQNDPANAQETASGNYIMDAITKGQQSIEQKNQTDPGWADKISGIAPTIVNSLQTPGSITSFIKGLFE